MALVRNYTIEKIWVKGGNITTVQFRLEFTDEDKPGVSSTHAGLVPVGPYALPENSSNNDIVDAIESFFGPQMNDLLAFHQSQIDFQYEMQTSTPVEVTPAPEEIPAISRRQFYQGLALKNIITKEEALSAIQTGALPAAIQSMVDGMTDEDAKFEATMLLAGATDFDREHPLVMVFAMAQQMSEAEVDAFWLFCHSL